MRRTTSVDIQVNLLERFNATIPPSLKELLERKHLYQSVSLSFEPKATLILDKSVEAINEAFLVLMQRSDWAIPADHVAEKVAATSGAVAVQAAQAKVWFKAPDVKLFCVKCDSVEAFNHVATRLLAGGCLLDNLQAVQTFALCYLCQACKSIPEVFVVRRHGLKLTLCGRAPMEHVEVPPFIPKPVQSFYRGGILAFQSGQVLAGNFMLRTVIEQWARRVTGSETVTQADRVLDAYMESLPKDFKDRFPSLRDLYAALSSDIHSALGSAELFEKARVLIAEHFDARRLYKLRLALSGEDATHD